jgi:peptidoglycan hydrolase CwlO-like protein
MTIIYIFMSGRSQQVFQSLNSLYEALQNNIQTSNQITSLQGEVGSIKTKVESLQGEVESIKTKVKSLPNEVGSNKTKVDDLQSKVAITNTKVEDFQSKVASFETYLKIERESAKFSSSLKSVSFSHPSL